MINKQILKFPAAMLLAGVALRVCMNGIISIWLRMGTPISSLGLFGIRLLLSVLLFLLVGRMVRRQYSKRNLFDLQICWYFIPSRYFCWNRLPSMQGYTVQFLYGLCFQPRFLM